MSDFNPAPVSPEEQRVRTWAMALHLSQFATYLAPVAGIVAPIVIWQIQKDKMPELDIHGKIVVNWLISVIIYLSIGFVLTFVLIGIPILMLVSALAVIYPIIGGIKASQGEVWRYPGSITFF
ncbi:DUF4870 domain-containing protein [Planctomicrobium piriforme]|uniref:DUF4870 domain-containing protein n=1 Tax=Planctomicrobium piriforme TaxID=1576369 RepID=A0A1I3J2D7_9PLAN|nr:DUF4870 domain-containing protein [Planctomicrobium piriforme]SFI54235.1 hypothetical protein SAMN05421753_11032 [Planctomicrobium piriforme]